MSLRDDLIAAKALIDTPEKWGKGLASFPARPTSKVDRLCAAAACARVADAGPAGGYTRMHKALTGALPEPFLRAKAGRDFAVSAPLPLFNDHPDTTHADVMRLFDRAIEKATRP